VAEAALGSASKDGTDRLSAKRPHGS
jgi:hypothetical protein